MRELPILFSTPMVQAILENRKTMTRRLSGLDKVNESPDEYRFDGNNEDGKLYVEKILPNGEYTELYSRVKPAYEVGDKLWVKETYFDVRKWKHAPLFSARPDFIYRADKDAFIGEHKWKPSLFMPKSAARIWLEVTGVRCERLQSISITDCIREGIEPQSLRGEEYRLFINLWESINGKDSWLENPWVFIYEFKRIEKP